MIGVYAIRNRLNGQCYIGASVDMYRRWKEHRSFLRRGICQHPLLKTAWLLYGEDCFEFVVLEICNMSALRERENRWLARQPPYNVFQEASGKGRFLTKETREKMSKALQGKTHTEATKRKMSATRKGRIGPMLGKIHSEETRRKMSESHKKRWKERGTNADYPQ